MDLALVLNTTDKYSHIWDAWYYHFKKHWRHDFPVYFLNEEKDITYPFTQIKVNIPEKNLWTKKFRESIVQIPEDNLFVLLEDLLLTEGFDEGEFEYIYDFFLSHDVHAMRILPKSRFTTNIPTDHDKIDMLYKNSKYLVSHQPNIWKKDFLLECIKHDESPWDNERRGTKRMLGMDFKIYHYRKIWFVNVLRMGKLVSKYKFMIDESQSNQP